MLDILVSTLKTKFIATISLVCIFFIIFILNKILFNSLNNNFSLIPREVSRLFAIFTSPFLHGSWSHLINNSVPFLILSWLLLTRLSVLHYYQVLFYLTLLTGVFVWICGRYSAHLGASGVIFGLFSFLITYAFFTKNWLDLIIAGIGIYLYGYTILAGITDLSIYISIESHLFGLVSGVMYCSYMSKLPSIVNLN